jgi:hypothetical protein
MAFRAERRLGEAIEQVLAELGEPVEQLFFYFAGYAMISTSAALRCCSTASGERLFAEAPQATAG